MPAKLEITQGMRFSRLTVISETTQLNQIRCFLCRCDCGAEKTIRLEALRSNRTQSCGCLGREMSRKNHTTHGMGESSVYHSWAAMLQRCRNPNNKDFPRYGGRGITVCERWLNIENFYADMGDKPSHHSIDRIDNNLGYSPENCRWATRIEQGNNLRNNYLITAGCITLTINQWATELSMSRGAIVNRLGKGWTPEKTFSTPLYRKGVRK